MALVLDQNQNGTSFTEGFGQINWVAQAFQVKTNASIYSVTMNLAETAGVGDVNVSIFDTNSSGSPTIILNNCTQKKTASEIPGSLTQLDFNFNTPCNILPNKFYAIVMHSSTSAPTAAYNTTYVNSSNSTNFELKSINNGVGWLQSATSLTFKVWTVQLNTDFNISKLSDLFLDGNGIYDFNSNSKIYGGNSIKDYNYFINGQKVKSSLTDGNLHWGFNTQGDYNISLIVSDTNFLVGQKDRILNIKNINKTKNINFDYSTSDNTQTNISFSAFFTGYEHIFSYNWGGFEDGNKNGQNVFSNFSQSGVKNICVTAETLTDSNVIYCETFYLTQISLKIPKDEKTFVNLTPFTGILDTTPLQTRTAITDVNFWIFWQNSMVNKLTIGGIPVEVGSYFPRRYLIFLDSNSLTLVIQPYLISFIDGMEVEITAQDSLTAVVLQNINFIYSRDLNSGGTLIQGNQTDSLGRAVFSFEIGADYNYSIYLDQNLFSTGDYQSAISDATNGFRFLLPLSGLGFNLTALSGIDVNFLQNSLVNAGINNSVDFNQTIVYDFNSNKIKNIRIIIDQNGVLLYDQNFSSGVSNGGIFGQNITPSINSINTIRHRIIFTFEDDLQMSYNRSFNISTKENLFNALEDVKNKDLGQYGTMLILAIVIAIGLGFLTIVFPRANDESNFILVAFILLFFSFFGWVNGFSYIFAVLAASMEWYRLKHSPLG